MSRIVEVKEELFDANGNVEDSYVREQYFKTKLDTKVKIELTSDFCMFHIVFTPDEEDFFREETLEAICRYLGHTNFHVTKGGESVTVHYFEGYIMEILEELAKQVDVKLDAILKEKGIDPNVKNDDFLKHYSEDFSYDIYEDIRNMYEEEDEEEFVYIDAEYTELSLKNIDDYVFSESVEEVKIDRK